MSINVKTKTNRIRNATVVAAFLATSLQVHAQTNEVGVLTFEKGELKKEGFANTTFTFSLRKDYDVARALKARPDKGYPIIEKEGQSSYSEEIFWAQSDNIDRQDTRTFEVTIMAKKVGKKSYFGVYIPTAPQADSGQRITYAFLVTKDKDYKIIRVLGPDSHSGKVEVIKEGGCAFIQPDNNAFVVTKIGNAWTFFVNGTSLYQFLDTDTRRFVHYAPFGIHLDGDGELYIPSFKITSPEPAEAQVSK